MLHPYNSLETDNQQIRESLDALGQQYQVRTVTEAEEADIQERLSSFEAFSAYQEVFIYGAVRLASLSSTCYFMVVSLNHQQKGLTAYQGQIPGLTELSYAGLASLGQDYRTVTVRPETSMERLIEYMYPTKVRFEAAPALHRQYRVMASDPQHLKAHLPKAFLMAIQQYEGLSLELQGHDLLARLPEGLARPVADALAGFLVRAAKAG